LRTAPMLSGVSKDAKWGRREYMILKRVQPKLISLMNIFIAHMRLECLF